MGYIGGEKMNDITRQRVKEHLILVMDRIINKRVVLEPFDEVEIYNKNPFGSRVVPVEIWKGSKFERSFVTSLGQGIYEQLGKIIAEGTDAAIVENQYVENFQINTFRNGRIDDILKKQRRKNNTEYPPDWQGEIEGIISLRHSDMTDVNSISDLFIERADGRREYYSLKTVKPNLDQTEIAKRSMLRLKAFNSEYETYFGLPFNPAGPGNLYRRAKHTVPYKLFNMDEDECVLMGADLWNKIGADPNTYDELLEIFAEVGELTAPRIKTEYLEIEAD